MNQNGFGLIQILIAIAIMAILVTVVAPRMKTFLGFGKESAAKQQLANIKLGVETYYARNGKYPESISQVVEYLDSDKVPADPWNKAYVYSVSGEKYTLGSCGPDNMFNTADDIVVTSQ